MEDKQVEELLIQVLQEIKKQKNNGIQDWIKPIITAIITGLFFMILAYFSGLGKSASAITHRLDLLSSKVEVMRQDINYNFSTVSDALHIKLKELKKEVN